MKSKEALKNDIINVLKQIYDPEIPISICALIDIRYILPK